MLSPYTSSCWEVRNLLSVWDHPQSLDVQEFCYHHHHTHGQGRPRSPIRQRQCNYNCLQSTPGNTSKRQHQRRSTFLPRINSTASHLADHRCSNQWCLQMLPSLTFFQRENGDFFHWSWPWKAPLFRDPELHLLSDRLWNPESRIEDHVRTAWTWFLAVFIFCEFVYKHFSSWR